MIKATTIDPSTINIILNKLEQLQEEIRIVKETVQSDQSWFWSEHWQSLEHEADIAHKNGDYSDFDNVDDLLNDLHAT